MNFDMQVRLRIALKKLYFVHRILINRSYEECN